MFELHFIHIICRPKVDDALIPRFLRGGYVPIKAVIKKLVQNRVSYLLTNMFHSLPPSPPLPLPPEFEGCHSYQIPYPYLHVINRHVLTSQPSAA